MRIKSLLSLMLATAGCAAGPGTPDDQVTSEYRREDARIEAIDNFEQLKRTCASAGGVVQLFRTSSGRMAPTTTELKMATCSARVDTGLPN